MFGFNFMESSGELKNNNTPWKNLISMLRKKSVIPELVAEWLERLSCEHSELSEWI
jgi:hypothetical protein